MNRRYARTGAAIATTAALALTLSACSTGQPSAGCEPATGSGGASNTVQATGALGSAPQVDFPTPLYSDGVQASVLIEGDGAAVQDGQYVTAEVTLLNGADGTVIERTGYDEGRPFAVEFDALPLGLPQGLECRSAGSRVALTIPAEDAFPGAQVPPPLTADDTIVAVVDLISAVPARAHGTVVPGAAGVPSVVRAPNGQPGITLPAGDPPSEYREATLIAGDGDETVADGDRVLVQYTGVNWGTGEVFESSWNGSGPTTLEVREGAVIPGFARAVVGKKVGSQVVAVLPPDEAYGEQGQGSIPPDSTLVFVIDILAIQ